MTNSEIETLIDYYGMVKEGDRIRITKHLDEAQAHLQDITAAKPRIMAYWVEKPLRERKKLLQEQLRFIGSLGSGNWRKPGKL